jgi:hypothetical protein
MFITRYLVKPMAVTSRSHNESTNHKPSENQEGLGGGCGVFMKVFNGPFYIYIYLKTNFVLAVLYINELQFQDLATHYFKGAGRGGNLILCPKRRVISHLIRWDTTACGSVPSARLLSYIRFFSRASRLQTLRPHASVNQIY